MLSVIPAFPVALTLKAGVRLYPAIKPTFVATKFITGVAVGASLTVQVLKSEGI